MWQDNKEGQEVLRLLRIAFDRKLTFQVRAFFAPRLDIHITIADKVGTSVTNGTDNCVVWNCIHHVKEKWCCTERFESQRDLLFRPENVDERGCVRLS